MHLISQIYFWNKTLRVSDSSSVHLQEFFTVHTAMVYVIQKFHKWVKLLVYNKICREKQLTPNYISIKINNLTTMYTNTHQ